MTNPTFAHRSLQPASPLRIILDRIGDKWSLLVIRELAGGGVRFGHLRSRIDDISQRMLTLTLRNLLHDGLIDRQVFPTTPPSVEYSLTDLGRSLLEPMRVLEEWAVTNYAGRDEALSA